MDNGTCAILLISSKRVYKRWSGPIESGSQSTRLSERNGINFGEMKSISRVSPVLLSTSLSSRSTKTTSIHPTSSLFDSNALSLFDYICPSSPRCWPRSVSYSFYCGTLWHLDLTNGIGSWKWWNCEVFDFKYLCHESAFQYRSTWSLYVDCHCEWRPSCVFNFCSWHEPSSSIRFLFCNLFRRDSWDSQPGRYFRMFLIFLSNRSQLLTFPQPLLEASCLPWAVALILKRMLL
jgi:hypothetical protein